MAYASHTFSATSSAGTSVALIVGTAAVESSIRPHTWLNGCFGSLTKLLYPYRSSIALRRGSPDIFSVSVIMNIIAQFQKSG